MLGSLRDLLLIRGHGDNPYLRGGSEDGSDSQSPQYCLPTGSIKG